jgi:hypothetical protein
MPGSREVKDYPHGTAVKTAARRADDVEDEPGACYHEIMMHARPTAVAAIALGTLSAIAAAIATRRMRVPTGIASEHDHTDAIPIHEQTVPKKRLRGVTDLPRDIVAARETGRETAVRVRELLRLRSRLDRVAWNTLGSGPLGACPKPGMKDWTERCMFLVSVGIAFEDMPEVLGRALSDPDGTSAYGSLLHRTVEAYSFLGAARVPARWSQDAMEETWRELCDAVAAIIGQEPDYGTPLPPPPQRSVEHRQRPNADRD